MALNALSFELRIMTRKRRMRIMQYKFGVKRTLCFVVAAQEAKTGQPLAPILGQVQLNTSEFCTSFNNKTKEYPQGLPLFVELKVNWDKTYSIEINPFPFLYYISSYLFLSLNGSWFISLVDVYKLLDISYFLYGLEKNISTLNSILGTLNSYGVCISYNCEDEYYEKLIYLLCNNWDIYFLLFKNAKGFGVFNGWLQTNCADLISDEYDDDDDDI